MALKLSFSPCGLDEMDSEEVMSIITPKVKRDLSSIFRDEQAGPSDTTPVLGAPKRSLFNSKPKRTREESDDVLSPLVKQKKRKTILMRRSLSLGDSPLTTKAKPADAEGDVMSAVNRLVEEDLVGDGSRSYRLPTIRSRQQDLKCITTETMEGVLRGDYDDVNNNFRVIDCRYPYEFNGGHIQGAENLYTHEHIRGLLKAETTDNEDSKKDVLIFHCEFSSERGPKMIRFLREQDRCMNQKSYPSLCYPEIYLLDGGYKSFYRDFKSLCFPMAYKPMLHHEHEDDLRHFRIKSKSWTAGEKKRFVNSIRV